MLFWFNVLLVFTWRHQILKVRHYCSSRVFTFVSLRAAKNFSPWKGPSFCVNSFYFLCNTTFTWWPRELSFRNTHCIWKVLMFIGSSRDDYAFAATLANGCCCWLPAAMLVPLRKATTWRLHSKIYFSIHLAREKLTNLYPLTDFDFSIRWRAALTGRNAKPVIYPRTAHAW